MNEKIRAPRLDSDSTSDDEKKFVLEDVFWVPVGNCGHRHSTSTFPDASRPEELEMEEESNLTRLS